MSEEIPFTYRALNAEERDALEQGLALASRLAFLSRPLTMVDVQKLYDDALREKRIGDEALIAIGLAFGQQIINQTGFDWVRVSDQWGDETCVGPAGKSLNCAPISMIQKRLDRDEAIDLATLAATISRSMNESIERGKVGDW